MDESKQKKDEIKQPYHLNLHRYPHPIPWSRLSLTHNLTKISLKKFQNLEKIVFSAQNPNVIHISNYHQTVSADIEKDCANSTKLVHIKKLQILYNIFDHILSNNKSINSIIFTNFNYNLYPKIDIFPLLQKINFDCLEYIDVSYTYLTSEAVNLFSNVFLKNYKLKNFCFFNIKTQNRNDYLILIDSFINYFHTYKLIISDPNITNNYDDIIELLLKSNYIDSIQLFFDLENHVQGLITNIINYQSQKIFDILLKIIEKNVSIRHFYISIYNIENSNSYAHRHLHYKYNIYNIPELIKIMIMLQKDNIVQTIKFNENISILTSAVHQQINLSPIEAIKDLLDVNGVIELYNFLFQNPFDYNSHIFLNYINERTKTNSFNNQKRNKNLFQLLLEHAQIYDYLDDKTRKTNLKIRKRTQRTEKSTNNVKSKTSFASRLDGYAKNKTLKFFRLN